jgi:lipopolysaccharide transport system ATP-binding protein
MQPAIKVSGLSKKYQLGLTHAGTVRDLVNGMARRLVGKADEPDPASGKGHASGDDSHIWALRDVSFEVMPGEAVGIIGRNGAGKSTLLRILSRITKPTTGRVEMRGRVASLLEVGTGFHPELTGRENIYMNGTILGMTRREIDRSFDSIVEFAETEQFLDTPVKRYSSGMIVRLGFSVAAHMTPDILVVDEVLAVGDAAFQKKCLGKMGEVAFEGRTVLFVSHNMAAVRKLCGSAIALKDGGLVDMGSADHVIGKYLADVSAVGISENLDISQFEAHKKNKNISVVLDSLKLLDKNGEVLRSVDIGQTIRIQIEYFARERLPHSAFGVAITDQYGNELLRLSTEPISGFEMPAIEGKGRLELEIPRVNFTGGLYYLSVYASRPKIEYLWKLENIMSLCVNPTDYYSSGFPMANWAGLTVAPHTWKHDVLS